MNLTPEQKEELRHAVLDFLAARSAASYPASTIQARIAAARLLDFTPGESHIAEAGQFLVGLGYVSVTPDQLGSTKFYEATSQGVLAHERGRL